MARRRHTPPIDSLGVSRGLTWVIAVDNWGKVLESRRVERGVDLYEELVLESLRYHRAGWEMEERMFYLKNFYVRKQGASSRRVYITSLDPSLLRLETQGRYDQFGWEFRIPSKGPYG